MGLFKSKDAEGEEPQGLDEPVLYFEEAGGKSRDPWTIRDACEGTQIFGATGSGKTSGSGRHLAIGMLKQGFGGLVLTAKPDERALWESYTRECGRETDLIVIEPDGKHRFNFLNYEHEHALTKGGKLTQSLVHLFSTAMEAGQDRDSTADPYWEDAVRQLLTNAIDLAGMATGKLRLSDIAKLIRTAPLRRADTKDDKWMKESVCYKFLQEAEGKVKDEESVKDLEETADYWLLDFAGLADRTRSVVMSSFTSKVTVFLRSPLRSLFCSDAEDTVTPDASHSGKVILLNIPVKDYGEAGRFAQVIFKTVWQRATERRNMKAPTDRPVFLWADESQYFVTKHDMLFQQTARSKVAATVYLTQNIPNYYAVMGGKHAQAATDSLLGNLQTKIFHANGDPQTNEWAERVFGKRMTEAGSMSVSNSHNDYSYTEGRQENFLPVVPAKAFTSLKKGGKPYASIVEAFVFQGGRRWKNGENYLIANFPQDSR